MEVITSSCNAYLLLTFLMYEELEVLQSMVTDEDLRSWFANQKLLHTTDAMLTARHRLLARNTVNTVDSGHSLSRRWP